MIFYVKLTPVKNSEIITKCSTGVRIGVLDHNQGDESDAGIFAREREPNICFFTWVVGLGYCPGIFCIVCGGRLI